MADLGTLVALKEFVGLHYLAGAVIGSVVGVGVNYLLSVFWVFEVRTMSNRLVELTIFIFLGIVGLGLNELALFVCLLWNIKFFATAVTFTWDFSSRQWLLFTVSAPAGEVLPAE